MSRALIRSGVIACSLALSTVAWAHPGHGTSGGQTAGHYLTEPGHLLPVAAAVGLAAVLAMVSRAMLRIRRVCR